MPHLKLVRRIPPLAWDVALGLLFVTVGQLELHIHTDDGFQAGSVALNAPLVLLLTLPVAFHRLYPRAALVTMLAAAVVPMLFVEHSFFFWGGTLPLMLANYSVARQCDDVFGRWSWAIVEASLFVMATRMHGELLWSNLFFSLVVFGGSWGIGRVLRRFAQQGAALRAALAQLAEEQAAREEAAVQAERGRIAVEMHDVVAHAVSLMVVQIGAARMALERAGGEQPRLREAEDTGRQALDELRRTLGVLRDRPESLALEPLPDLASTTALVARFQHAGLQVSLDSSAPDGLPASLQLATYRILQEALTNALKHAGQVPVQASVQTRGRDLVVEVTNAAGTRQPITAGGNGLAGMRERVGMFGGQLRAGDTEAGFEVCAVIPLPFA